MADVVKHTKPSEWGKPPFRYECVGDVDGHLVGYDHFVYDADGEELTNAPNERVGMLFAAAPDLLTALRGMLAAARCGYDPKVALIEFGEKAEEAIKKATGEKA